MTTQFVGDETGKRTAVLLSITDYERLMEDLQNLAAVAERREEPTITHEEFIKDLKRDGLLPD